MSEPIICIDFGSSRTKVARINDSGSPELIGLGTDGRAVIPSVFYLPPDGGAVLVGDDAEDMADNDPAGLVTGIKREIHRPGKIRCGAGRSAPERWELTACLFRQIRERCETEVFHRQNLESCVLTVPVCFNEAQRDKLRRAAENAGFKTIRMIEEPVAAAMHWLSTSGRQHSEYVVVVDIGGGTTDLAALRLVNEKYEAIADLPHAGFLMGGNDIDEQIRQVLVKAAPEEGERGGGWLVRLRRLKEQLSRDSRNLFKVNLAGQSCEVPREVVAEAVASFVERAKGEVRKFLDDFTELTGNRDCPILLAGGGARLRGIQEELNDIGDVAKGRLFLWNEGEFAIVKGGLLAIESCSPPTVASSNPTPPMPPEPKTPRMPPVLSGIQAAWANTTSKDAPDPAAHRGTTQSPVLAGFVGLREVFKTEGGEELKRQQATPVMVDACERAADAGVAEAQWLFGECLTNGTHRAKDPAKAFGLFLASADQGNGNTNGQYAVGRCYHHGVGVPKDSAAALKYYRLAADQDHSGAQITLARCYCAGDLVSRDMESSKYWCNRAGVHNEFMQIEQRDVVIKDARTYFEKNNWKIENTAFGGIRFEAVYSHQPTKLFSSASPYKVCLKVFDVVDAHIVREWQSTYEKLYDESGGFVRGIKHPFIIIIFASSVDENSLGIVSTKPKTAYKAGSLLLVDVGHALVAGSTFCDEVDRIKGYLFGKYGIRTFVPGAR